MRARTNSPQGPGSRPVGERRRWTRALGLIWMAHAVAAMAVAAPPVLMFSDLNWGPKSGWEGSSSRGAAVTVWGRNLGTQGAESFVTVNGAELRDTASYAEWGVAGPARGLERITFWLNPDCADGDGSITVTVNGEQSNPLPFRVAAGTIYFVSARDGNNNANGRYATARDGTNGPFRDIYRFSPHRNPSGNGQYIVYVRDGQYSTPDPAGDSTLVSMRGPFGGPDQRKALVGYPSESPVLDTGALSRAAFWNADYAPYGRNSYFTYAKLTMRNGGVGVDIYGDHVRVVGNRFESMLRPAWAGVVMVRNAGGTRIHGNLFANNGAVTDGSYKHNVYVLNTPLSQNVDTQDTDIGWNEFADAEAGPDARGGVIFARRSNQSATQLRGVQIHANLFRGGNQNFIEIGDGPAQSEFYIYNNVFHGGYSDFNPMVYAAWNTTECYVTNNTFFLTNRADRPLVGTAGTNGGTRLVSQNNIFYAHPGQQFFRATSGSSITSDNDLFFAAGGTAAPVSGSGVTVTRARTGDPMFAAQNQGDFRLREGSPAVDTGAPASVRADFHGLARPQGAGLDLGAHERGVDGTEPRQVSVAVSPLTGQLGEGASMQFSAQVSGADDVSVRWSVEPLVGQITAGGLYTAPAVISTQTQVRVTATSVADPLRSATAVVTLTPPPPVVEVSVTPLTGQLIAGQSLAFTAVVSGTTNQAVVWSRSPELGAISAAGVYTAPAAVSARQTVRVRATSVADPARWAEAVVTVDPAPAPPPPPPTDPVTPPAGGDPTVTPPSGSEPTAAYRISFTPVSATTVRVDWVAPAGHDARDFITLTGVGSPTWYYLERWVTGTATSGSFTAAMPTRMGAWEFRLVRVPGDVVAARSAILGVQNAGFSVRTPVAEAAAGQSVTFTWTAPSGRPRGWEDRIILVRASDSNDRAISSVYTRGAMNGSVTFRMPAAGEYEVRYQLGGYGYVAASAPAKVTVR